MQYVFFNRKASAMVSSIAEAIVILPSALLFSDITFETQKSRSIIKTTSLFLDKYRRLLLYNMQLLFVNRKKISIENRF